MISKVITLTKRILLCQPQAVQVSTHSVQCAVLSHILRSTMSQERLNSVHVHKDQTDALDLHHVGSEFISKSE